MARSNSHRFPRFILRDTCQHCERGKKGIYEGEGKLVCASCGHHLEQYQPIIDDENNPFGLQLAGKSTATDDGPTELTGREKRVQAQRLYFLIFQTVLRQQTSTLILTKSFPAELEVVVRDLWLLWQSNFPSAPFPLSAQAQQADDTDAVNDTDTDDGRASRASSAVSSSVFSSLSETSDASDLDDLDPFEPDYGANPHDSAPGADLSQTPSLIQSVCLVFLACRLLRLPITLADLHAWIARRELWLDSIKDEMPAEMVETFTMLDRKHRALVQSRTPIGLDQLFDAVTRLEIGFIRRLRVKPPTLNWPLLAYRYAETMLLPVEVTLVAHTVVSLAGFSFSWTDVKMARRRTKQSAGDYSRSKTGYRYVSADLVEKTHLPDVQLISALVVATKLLFPPPPSRRLLPAHSGQLAPTFDWPVWLAKAESWIGRLQADRPFDGRRADQVHEPAMWNVIDDSEVEKYITWVTNTYVRTQDGDHPARGSPTSGTDNSNKTEGLDPPLSAQPSGTLNPGKNNSRFDCFFQPTVKGSRRNSRSTDVETDGLSASSDPAGLDELKAVIRSFGTPASDPPTTKGGRKAKGKPSPEPDVCRLIPLGLDYPLFQTEGDLDSDSDMDIADDLGDSMSDNDDDSVEEQASSVSNLAFERRCYRTLYQFAARCSGVPLQVLIKGVIFLERRLSDPENTDPTSGQPDVGETNQDSIAGAQSA